MSVFTLFLAYDYKQYKAVISLHLSGEAWLNN